MDEENKTKLSFDDLNLKEKSFKRNLLLWI